MKKPHKKFVPPAFQKGKTGEEFAADVARIYKAKSESHSASAQTAAIATLWNEKLAQGQANARNASGIRKKKVTKKAILESKAGYIANYGHERGWLNYVALDLGVDPKTIRKRLEQEN
jgi:hypothetical protein